MHRRTTPVILVVVVVLLCFGAWWGMRMLTHPVTKPAQSCVVKTASVLSTSEVQVRVLNAGSVRGRAGDLGNMLSGKGFDVVSTTNTSGQVPGTMVVGNSADDPEVMLLVGFLPGATPSGDGRSDHRVDVIVNDNFGGFNQDAPTTVDVPGGTICVPVPSGTATP
ncbi:LytR C-terminal domain-containing protein [Propionibacterium sp.]|uniref:LytR C-terminal domain-containing protein n=1 Tax=Propionibacterium sp. TaxID=1977903 RepID=UPI0039E80C6A